jgi:hypothetical protein
MKRLLLLFALLAAPAQAAAPVDDGWQEAVISVLTWTNGSPFSAR